MSETVCLVYLMRRGEQLAVLLTTADIEKTTAVGSLLASTLLGKDQASRNNRTHTGKQRHKHKHEHVCTHAKTKEEGASMFSASSVFSWLFWESLELYII